MRRPAGAGLRTAFLRCALSLGGCDYGVLVRVRDSRVAAVVCPDCVGLSARVDGDSGVVADERTRELEVRVGLLAADPRFGTEIVRRATDGVVETDGIQIVCEIDRIRVRVRRIARV